MASHDFSSSRAFIRRWPLKGWLFHGTTAAKAEMIMNDGMETTEVMLRDDDDDVWFTQGSHWGQAIVAAGYAEDVERIELSQPDPLRLIAIQIDDLQDECVFEVDEPTLDFPEERLIGMSAEKLETVWGPISDSATWVDSLKILGSLAAVHSHIIKGYSEYRVETRPPGPAA